MKLYIVFAQRKENRAGEYAPEALFVVTEYDRDENPQWIAERLQEVKADEEYIGADIFEVDIGSVGQDRIRRHLLEHPKIDGYVMGALS